MALCTDASVPLAKREECKEAATDIARKECGGPAPEIPAVLGTIDDLRSRWQHGEIEFRREGLRIQIIDLLSTTAPEDPADLDLDPDES
jgi:hypothetical protein